MILDAMDLPELFGPTNTLSLCLPMEARLIGPMFSSLTSLNFTPAARGGASHIRRAHVAARLVRKRLGR